MAGEDPPSAGSSTGRVEPVGRAWPLGRHNPAIAKVGDALFVHGGISAEYAKLSLDAVNRRVAAAMVAGDDGPKSVLDDPLGPLWYRGLTGRDPAAEQIRATGPPAPHLTVEQELDTVLSAYGAKHLIIGHTPSLQGIVIQYDGRLARIDTGNSLYYGGPLSWLEILGDTLIPHT